MLGSLGEPCAEWARLQLPWQWSALRAPWLLLLGRHARPELKGGILLEASKRGVRAPLNEFGVEVRQVWS